MKGLVRSLRPDEQLYNNCTRAKDPTATVSLAGHISHGNIPSQYTSYSGYDRWDVRDSEKYFGICNGAYAQAVAYQLRQAFKANGEKTIVRLVSASAMDDNGSTVFDVSTVERAHAHGVKGQFANFAGASREWCIIGAVPCVKTVDQPTRNEMFAMEDALYQYNFAHKQTARVDYTAFEEKSAGALLDIFGYALVEFTDPDACNGLAKLVMSRKSIKDMLLYGGELAFGTK